MQKNTTQKILITGANGQLGSELADALAAKFGTDNIIITDISIPPNSVQKFKFEKLDVMDFDALVRLVKKYHISQIYHLAAILSAKGENNPKTAWKINMDGLLNVLEVARIFGLDKVFWPSSIAVFGPSSPKNLTPQHSITEPETNYGISKHAGELWCNYYFQKYGVDVRSLRYPGIIGYKSMPGGGTTDYAVEVFHKAVNNEPFICFLEKDMHLPMMFMPDAIKATLQLMDAKKENIKVRTSYNIQGMSFSPEALISEIKKYYPELLATYQPDFRQKIAESWPASIDDKVAKKEWNWKPDFTIKKMVKEMFVQLEIQKKELMKEGVL
ncbi:NAD-dependent epimerase/dehydratase family protein [Flexithrix dorotheae]|uniref:NAD-dependent epimerase/dehydratase family protein n=1 Tax=Flexithrix dorotheae TaxID=70993 RepID=UPI00036289B0|nr:NAD-dependent epimerase/dehydratase family protein [Flexithrix dorotheae]